MVSLAVRGLSFSRPSGRILTEVGFTLEPGQVVAVAGPNGVGKTTLIRLLMGLLHPSGGSTSLCGKELSTYSRPALARLVAYVPQGMPGIFPMNVFDLVLLGRRPHLAWRPSRADLERTAQALCQLGVEDLAERDAHRLSGGQLQKVLIARALAQDTPFLFLDEPTSSLDLRHQLEVMELLRSLARDKGARVLASMHDVNMARRFADNVLLLDKGRTYGFGPPEDVLHEASLREVYGVEVARVDGCGLTGFLPLRAST
jgi:iron complex transport system ATP-binding protein